MLKILENLQYGFHNPKSFQTSVANQRIVNLSLSSRVQLEKFHTGGVNALDVDKIDERYLISGAKDGSLCIHDLQNDTGKAGYTARLICEVPRHSRYSHSYSIDTVQWYPFDTGLFVSSGMDAKVKLWDTNVMRPAEVFNMPYKVNAHHMSPIASQHSLIALAMKYPNAVLLDPKSGSFCHELRAHQASLPTVQWSPTCEHVLATGGADSKIFLWDIRSAKGYLTTLDQHNGEAQASRRDLVTAHGGAVNGLRFTDDGLYLVSFGTDCRLRLWDVALSQNTLVNYGSVTNNDQHRRRSFDVCCDTAPPVVFVPSSNYVLALDMLSGQRLRTLVGHFGCVNCCLYRPATHELFSGGNDLNILLWTPDTQQELAEHRDAIGEMDVIDDSPMNSDDWSTDEEAG